MELTQAVIGRRSIRAFLPEPVDQDTIKKVIDVARWAPSWGNTQPWEVYVVSGEKVKAITQDFVGAIESASGENPDITMPLQFPEPLMGRYKKLGKALFEVLDIPRDDTDKRMAHYKKNFRAFGAPHLVYVAIKDDLTPYAIFDAGMVALAIALAAHDRGLGTCMLAAMVRYPEIVRKHLPLPQGRKLVIGLALGYPDPDHPANTFIPTREPLDDVVTFY